MFYAEGGKARVLSDINSLTSFGGMSEDWTINRVVRVMDGWANDVARIFSPLKSSHCLSKSQSSLKSWFFYKIWI